MKTIVYLFLFSLLLASGCKAGRESDATNQNANVEDSLKVEMEDVHSESDISEE